ncbi:GNAT family N-acetyltransferase [Alkalihalophilus pseudofirmus]|uniref:GNAT family N-acetyltransferase n=1 Tax=Alkalihalophilus pseudofirmus TaxID=79885 RepID=UPI0009522CC8|nr:GNAT family N-acetyltransferase [Alkalihalophilus pseudofirmus]
MEVRLLNASENPPMDLLLLADPSEKLIADYVERGECFIAEESGEIIGVLVLLPTRPDTVELVNVAVCKDMQGRGIGRRLVEFAVDSAKKQGFKTIEVGTGNSSIGQIALYQKCGFRMIGVDVDFFISHYEEEIYEDGIQCRDMVRLSQDLF